MFRKSTNFLCWQNFSGFHLLLISVEEHGWALKWLFVFSGNEAGQLKNIKGLMHVVLYASKLKCQSKFLSMQNIMQWWTRIHPASVSMFISLFKTSVNVASLYGADSLLALDLHLLLVYLCKWYEYVHAHINEAPTDVWDQYEYVSGVGPGSWCVPEIQALLCFRRAEISAHGNIPGLLWEEVLVLWSMQMWCCLPLQRCMLFLENTCLHLRTKKTLPKVLPTSAALVDSFLSGCMRFGRKLPRGGGTNSWAQLCLLSIVCIFDPTLGSSWAGGLYRLSCCFKAEQY